jgi:hypothetical protein
MDNGKKTDEGQQLAHKGLTGICLPAFTNIKFSRRKSNYFLAKGELVAAPGFLPKDAE